jgi:hypothetical protein
MDKDWAIKKVQKLMAMAQDGRGNENEAERALAQAEALMRKFGIEQAEVGTSDAAKGFDWANDFAPYGVERQPAASVPTWYGYVAFGCAIFTDTIVKTHYRPGLGYGVGFYGERTDVAFAVWLVTYLRDTVWREVRKQQKENGWGRKESEDFRQAMASRLQARMKKLRKERDAAFAEASSGTALVLVNQKLALRDAEFGVQKVKHGPARSASSVHAIEAGRATGDRVGFARPLAGGQKSNLLK